MKTLNAYYLRPLLLTLLLQLLIQNLLIKQVQAQPQYTLTAKHIWQDTPSQFQFDIYLTRTGGGTEPYVKGQFVLTYNPAILPVGGVLSMAYVAGSSWLPTANQSTNCLTFQGGAQGYCLYITAPLDNAGTTIPDYPAEVRVGTYRVSNTLPFNTTFPLNLSWRSATPNPYTKIWYYNGNSSFQLSNLNINYYVASELPLSYVDYDARLINDVQINSNTYEFDIYYRDKSVGLCIVVYGLQICLLFDDTISNGGILSSNYIPGTSQMSSDQIPSDPEIISVVGGKRVWKLGAIKTTFGLSTHLSSSGYGTRVGRFRITTTAPAFRYSRPNIAWNFSLDYGFKTILEGWECSSQSPPYDMTIPPVHFNSLSNPILPVELISFTANPASNRNVLLNWTTATEVNNYGFEIQRHVLSQKSAVGNNDFETIGFVAGSGNSNSTKSYNFVDNKLNGGSKFAYRLKQIDNNGTFTYSSIQEVELIPSEYVLSQNYPNPFNPTTTIEYIIPQAGQVSLSVYDVLGERVSDLVNEFKEIGIYSVDFDASNLSSGSYIYVLKSNGNTVSKKLTIIK